MGRGRNDRRTVWPVSRCAVVIVGETAECEWRVYLDERGYGATTPRISGRFAVRTDVEHDFCVVAAPRTQKAVPSGCDLAVFGDSPSLLLLSN